MSAISKLTAFAAALALALCAWFYVSLTSAEKALAYAHKDIAELARDNAELQNTVQDLEEHAARLNVALAVWRTANESIVQEREQKRVKLTTAAKRDPSLAEQLALPLHPALRRGGGLLGKKNTVPDGSANPASFSDAHPGP